DGPFSIRQDNGEIWSPKNYSNKFYGPSTLRLGLEKSRNLMTVRLANKIGMGNVSETAKKFGIDENMRRYLAFSLGAGETTLLNLTTAYGMLANGGKKIEPTFIDRIQDRTGETVFSFDKRACVNCGELIRWGGQTTPNIIDNRAQIADEKHVYQIVSLMEGVVQRGTATRLKALNRPLAGKTGTTNESKDTWFIGFTPNLVVGVFVGFDDPKSLGKRETGSSVAAPIFKDFMGVALQDEPAIPFRMPPGMKNVRVNAKTGRLAFGGENVIWEAFIPGTEPSENDYIIDTAIIDGDEFSDPYGDAYGYERSAFPTYNDGSVEVYGFEGQSNDSFSYFSNRRNNPQYQRELNDQAPSYGYNSERVPVPSNTPQQPTNQAPIDPDFTGTGGLY
ncbi:MAG: penicillin-binding transpeptidase domain-containing protein, partial [Pseudomonadota bacterium]